MIKPTFTQVTAVQNFLCGGCGWDVMKGEQCIAINHRQVPDDDERADELNHWDNICLHCDEIRKDKTVVTAEVVA